MYVCPREYQHRVELVHILVSIHLNLKSVKYSQLFPGCMRWMLGVSISAIHHKLHSVPFTEGLGTRQLLTLHV
jgi:hypothetical protein